MVASDILFETITVSDAKTCSRSGRHPFISSVFVVVCDGLVGASVDIKSAAGLSR